MAVAEALTFDMYGTLVDPIRIWKQLEYHIPGDAQRIAEIWRQKQLEFTFRLTAMERYEDFEQVTRKALDYALSATGHILGYTTKKLTHGSIQRPRMLCRCTTRAATLERSGLYNGGVLQWKSCDANRYHECSTSYSVF